MPARPAAGCTQAAPAAAPGSATGLTRPAGSFDPAAFDVLDAVDSRDAYANLLLPRLLADRGIAGRDAALATELAYGTLRGQGTYDAVLAACSDRPLGKLDPPVLLALRIGAHQLLATRVGSHAAVATSVDLAKDVAGARASGYVNAVLRRVATRALDEWLPIVAPAPDGRSRRLPVGPAQPPALDRGRLPGSPRPRREPPSELEAALAAGNERPRVTMAVTPGAAGRDEVMPAGAEPARWSPYGFTLPGGDPASLIAGGQAAVQDEASQLAALLLARAPVAQAGRDPGRAPAWLDMCAGPGGKARMLHGLATLDGARAGRRGDPPAPRPAGRRRGQWAASASPRPRWGPGRPNRGRRGCWSRTAAIRPGAMAPLTGSWWTCRAPGWAPCGAGPRLAGARPRRTCPSWVTCSAPC